MIRRSTLSSALLVAQSLAFAPLVAQEPGSSSAILSPSGSVLSGTALVANQGSASATIVDVATRRATAVDVGTGPHEAAISPDGRRGVVTIYGDRTPGNRLAVIDLADGSLARHIDLGDFRRPHGAVFVPGSNSVVAITSEASQRLLLVDIDSGRIMVDIPTQGDVSHMVAITADGKRAYTANIRSG